MKPHALESCRGRLKAWLNMHLVDHGLVRSIYNNFYHLGGGMYRSSQPSPAQIRRYHRRYGLKTILNLRGESPYGSYPLEREACAELGIELVDLTLFSRAPPSRARIHALKDTFERIGYPALMHCKSGADRAGMAAALYRILHLGHPVEDAMAELHWKYGHFKRARTGVQDFFLASYLAHARQTPIGFMEWVDTVYDERALKTQFRADGWSSLLVDKVLHRE
ncbi:fused DSP-PTPase phosphatase/NAD kinase-like protein [Thauera sinica]|uniref:Tyrosine-protein phosphatase n=1 Tax=Thauera sinica TaxID=2665146 RepID=A0ABW1APQ4_9RHOO|nr:tyrosine-protein phosphatase [Thauera sp. K11]ATE62301.1 tyrosine protein phosphatase [Thauera sp. K11]